MANEAERPSRAPKAAAEGKAVRVWGELGLTICIDAENRNFIRPLIGHERWARSDSRKNLKEAVAELEEFNEEILVRWIKRAKILAQEAADEVEEDDDSVSARARRKARDR